MLKAAIIAYMIGPARILFAVLVLMAIAIAQRQGPLIATMIADGQSAAHSHSIAP